MTVSLLAFCEAAADFRVISKLVDRVSAERGPQWVRDSIQDDPIHVRRWVDERATSEDCPSDEAIFIAWKNLKQVRKQVGVRPARGHFSGSPAEPDAVAARTALDIVRALQRRGQTINATLLVRDADDQPERRAGLEQARTEAERASPSAVVIGVADPMREAWVLAAVEPRSDEEERLLEETRRELGFHPCERAHQLRAKHKDAKTSAKRVLAVLLGEQPRGEIDCLEQIPLEELERRGSGSGLKEFMSELAERLLPVVAGQ